VTYKTAKPQDIFQFAQDMSEQCHIRVRVTPDAAAYLSGGGESGSKTQRLATVPSPVMNSGEMKPLAMFGAEANGNSSAFSAAASRYITDVSYSGNFGGVMDLVTARMGCHGNTVMMSPSFITSKPSDSIYSQQMQNMI
jgi:hypothetical protein